MYMSRSPLIVGFLKFPILFFSIFAWCPTTPIPIINLSPLLFRKLGSTLSRTSFQTWGNDCSDYETRRFHRDSFVPCWWFESGRCFTCLFGGHLCAVCMLGFEMSVFLRLRERGWLWICIVVCESWWFLWWCLLFELVLLSSNLSMALVTT